MEKISPKHIYGVITVSADELRLWNLNKDFFPKQLEKNLTSAYLQLISDVEKERKRTEIIVVNR